ncbi:hypothetical protein ACF08N_29455 [Streptomyces sp. NPDC015127]|uniref:hypothetical protein n=1 Tax=Streptomyces sp. NPDC015127 TaxID=3364939 RepID=UPI00370274E7
MSEFVTPDPQLLINAFGVAPEITGETQRTLRFKEVTGEDVTFSYDAIGRSVGVSWLTDSGELRMRLFREGARLLRVVEEDGRSCLLVEFRTADTAGELKVQILPVVSVTESMLFAVSRDEL